MIPLDGHTPHPRDYGGILPVLNSDCTLYVCQSLFIPRCSRLITEARATFSALVNLRATCRKSRHLVEVGIPMAVHLSHFSWFIAQRSYPLNVKVALLGTAGVWFQDLLKTLTAELCHRCHYCGEKPAPVYAKFTRRICHRCYTRQIITYDCVKAQYNLNDRQVGRLKYLIPFTSVELQMMTLQRRTSLFGFRSPVDTRLDSVMLTLFLRDDIEENLFRV